VAASASAFNWLADDAVLAAMTPAERARYLTFASSRLGGEPLRDFICRLTPHRPPPKHVNPIIHAMERARHGPIRVVISLPPRHVKTETIMNGLAWWMTQTPADTNAYASYNQEQAEGKSRIIRERALAAGVELKDDTASVHEWRTTAGGGLVVGKGLTGKGVQGLLVIDDLFKDMADANSRAEREKKWEWFCSVAMTRLEGASVIMVGTRWHKDDVIGRVIAQDDEREADGLDREWEVINLAALAEAGDPLGRPLGACLWPGSPYDETYLKNLKRTIGEYVFAALFQGRPRPKGSTLFGRPTYYDPKTFKIDGKRIVIYADPAATKKTTGDFSVILAMAVDGYGATQKGWILEVDRERRSVPKFMTDLSAFQARWGNTSAKVEAFGMAKAIPDMLVATDEDARVEGDTPPGDKFLRAQPAAAAWNDPEGSRLLVPISAPWLKDFLGELEDFTGVNDAHDDQVDCVSGAWNSVTPPPTHARLRTTAPRRM